MHVVRIIIGCLIMFFIRENCSSLNPKISGVSQISETNKYDWRNSKENYKDDVGCNGNVVDLVISD